METSGPEVRDLLASFGNEGSDFEHLLDYGDFRYHLLLEFNQVESECTENIALNRLYDAVSRNDQDAVQVAVDDCLGVLWPFLRSDYASRAKSIPKGVIKLQAITTNSMLHAQSHEHHLEYPPTKAIDNSFPDVTTYTSSDVEQLEEINMHIFRVKVHDSIYCMKTIHRTGREADFVREVSTLQRCCHTNIIRLVGLVEAEDSDKIEGMLIDYVDNARVLRDIDILSTDECQKLAGQIKEAIEYLHDKGLVWGDAKAANVLVDEDGNAVLIDFGGGYTNGWVDEVNHDTVCGDLQGLERIISFMRTKIYIRSGQSH